MEIRSFDHVALWVPDRGALAKFLCHHLGLHVIEETEAFTLVGADARRGKLTLFAVEDEREPGPLARVTLAAADLEAIVAGLPGGARRNGDSGRVELEAPGGLPLALEPAGGDVLHGDITSVSLRLRDPRAALGGFEALGWTRDDGGLAIGPTRLELLEGDPDDGGRPLLNHLALLVDDAAAARDLGAEVTDVKDAENTFAVFLRGPEGVSVEYVEHKETFSLV